jgi:hypothetical protein
VATTCYLDHLLDLLMDVFTPEVASAVLGLRADSELKLESRNCAAKPTSGRLRPPGRCRIQGFRGGRRPNLRHSALGFAPNDHRRFILSSSRASSWRANYQHHLWSPRPLSGVEAVPLCGSECAQASDAPQAGRTFRGCPLWALVMRSEQSSVKRQA